MSSVSLLLDMAAFFEPIGILGVVVAVASAVVAAVALVRRNAGVFGGAVSLWLVGTVLSVAFGATGGWAPTCVAAVAMPGLALCVGIARLLTTSRQSSGMR